MTIKRKDFLQRSILIIRRSEFRYELNLLIDKGSQIHQKPISSKKDLILREGEINNWVGLVSEFLNNSFNKKMNEYSSGFFNSEDSLGLMEMFDANGNSFERRVLRQEGKLKSKIDYLNNLAEKSKYLLSEIEDNNTFYPNENFSEREREKLIKSIDEILGRLEKLNLGQEIIFNEVDELRNLFNLNKKNWNQLLKGKLFDLGLNKVTDPKLLDWIYKKLTGDSMPLLS